MELGTVYELDPWPRGARKEILFWNGKSDIETARRHHLQTNVKRPIAHADGLEQGFRIVALIDI